jgi:hypothetical protein
MAIRLFAGRQNTWGLQGNSNANFAATPYKGNTIMVKKNPFGFHRQLE